MDAHYVTIKNNVSYLVKNYTVESQVHGLATEMFSHSFIDIDDLEEITKIVLTRDKMTALLVKLLRRAGHMDYERVYGVLVGEIRSDEQRWDVVEELEQTLANIQARMKDMTADGGVQNGGSVRRGNFLQRPRSKLKSLAEALEISRTKCRDEHEKHRQFLQTTKPTTENNNNLNKKNRNACTQLIITILVFIIIANLLKWFITTLL